MVMDVKEAEAAVKIKVWQHAHAEAYASGFRDGIAAAERAAKARAAEAAAVKCRPWWRSFMAVFCSCLP